MIVVGALLFSIVVLWVDLQAGPLIRMPALLIIPVMIFTWYFGIVAGGVLAIGLPIVRVCLEWEIPKLWTNQYSMINATIVVFVFCIVVFLVHFIKLQKHHIKVLQGFLPICSFCKKIRTKEDTWEQLEQYISKNSDAKFTHSLCPACAKEQYDFVVHQDSDRLG
jgi:hypothetical protein